MGRNFIMYEKGVISYLLRLVKADMAVNALHIMRTTEIAFSGLMCLINLYVIYCRSQWLRGLRCDYEAASLLGLRVRIPSEAWSFVCCVVCCQVEVSATGRKLFQRSPNECGGPDCPIETLAVRWLRVNRADEVRKKVCFLWCVYIKIKVSVQCSPSPPFSRKPVTFLRFPGFILLFFW